MTWRVRFRFRHEQTTETFNDWREAQTFCDDIKNRGVLGALRLLEIKQDENALTVDQLAQRWLTWKANDSDVRSDRTVADYRRDYNNWVEPTFGSLPAAVVDEAMVQEWVDAMGAGTLGRGKLEPKSIADRHMILHSMYAWGLAPTRRLVEHNPCTSSRLPKRRKKQPKGMRPAEWQALYAALAQIDADAADLAEFLLATGWRVSEAGAVGAFEVEDYCDHDVEGCRSCPMFVTMGRVIRRNAAGEHVIVEDAKSEAGNRRIGLDPDAAAMVRRRLAKVHGNGLVFTTRLGNQWHHPNFLNRYWNPAVKAAGLERAPTPHWLRHTSVAWLGRTGKVSLPELQRRIGHENIGTTIDVYGRMIEDVSPEALEAFAAMRRATPPRALDAGEPDALPPHTPT